MSLTNRILVAMVAGVLAGSLINLVLHATSIDAGARMVLEDWLVNGVFDAVGDIFVRSLKMLVVPLVFVSLVCGASSLGDSARIGPIAGKTLLYYLATTAIAVSMALLIATVIEPGSGVQVAGAMSFEPAPAPPLKDVLVDIFPSNPIAAMAEGKMLQIIVFALLFGYAISHAGDAGSRIAGFFSDLEVVVMRVVAILMELAPFGVFALLARLFADMGLSAIVDLGAYFLTVLAVLLIHGFLVYPLLLRVFAGLPARVMQKKMRSVWAFAFSTASSGATLPITLRTVEKKLGVHNTVGGFTVPLGATINMDGTAIMQGVATVFIAGDYGIDLTLGAFVSVILTATLASIGTAAVPGVGLITLAMVLEQAGLPLEGIALIIGVDRLLDMVRTAVNVTGDATASVIVAASEKQIDLDVYYDPAADTQPQVDDVPAPSGGAA